MGEINGGAMKKCTICGKGKPNLVTIKCQGEYWEPHRSVSNKEFCEKHHVCTSMVEVDREALQFTKTGIEWCRECRPSEHTHAWTSALRSLFSTSIHLPPLE